MTTEKSGISPLYWEIGKQLAESLVLQYATVSPGVSIAVTVAKSIMDAQAAIAAHNAIIVRAQAEGWADDDERWDAPLAEQQDRMDVENRRHDSFDE